MLGKQLNKDGFFYSKERKNKIESIDISNYSSELIFGERTGMEAGRRR